MSKNGKPLMLTAREYAERHGYNKKTVLKWCANKRLPGVKKQKNSGSIPFAYMIPEDAEPIRPKRNYTKKKPTEVKKPKPAPKIEPPKPKYELNTNHEKAEHVKRYCGLHTYRQLSEETGWPISEVRRVYERLHEAYGL